MRRTWVVAGLGAALLLTGCGADKPKPYNAGWYAPFWNPQQHLLYVGVNESTLDPGDSCFTAYTTHARWTGTEFAVTATASMPNSSSHDACNDMGVQAWAIVRLPHPFNGQPMRDTRTGKVKREVSMSHPIPDQIVNRAT